MEFRSVVQRRVHMSWKMVASYTGFLLWSVVSVGAAGRVPCSIHEGLCPVAARGLMLVLIQIALAVCVQRFFLQHTHSQSSIFRRLPKVIERCR
jgi:hypothetical protein